MSWIEDYSKQIKEEQDRLKKMLPSAVIKDVPLSFLKKVSHILEIPNYASVGKRELIENIILVQQEYQEKDRSLYDTIIYFVFDEEVCCNILINENCKFFPYIMEGKKFK